MASSLSTYLKLSAEIKKGSRAFLEKMRVLGTQYTTLSVFKNASIESFNTLKNAEGQPLIKRFRAKEVVLVRDIQDELDANISIEENFIRLLTTDFINKQLTNINSISLEKLNANPMLCSALKLSNLQDLLKFYVYSLATRSIVTSMGYLIQNLLLYSNSEVYDGKYDSAGDHVKWDLIIDRLDGVKHYIEVKSGPNDLDKGQVKSYAKEIQLVEEAGHKGYIGIAYGKKSSDAISINLFKTYLDEWETKTLIGKELWSFVSLDDSYHEILVLRMAETAQIILANQSIITLIDNKINDLTLEFTEKYNSIEEYIAQLW